PREQHLEKKKVVKKYTFDSTKNIQLFFKKDLISTKVNTFETSAMKTWSFI
ncbi:hypothetical protein L9F63_017219, partial [Diploptera punctata]